MCLNANHHRQRGFSLPLAIFILVVTSLLALALFRMNELNQNGVAQEVLSARALLAAESGAQAQMMTLFPINGSATCAAQNIVFNAPGLAGCSAVSSCSVTIVNSKNYFDVESSGRCDNGNVSARRIIQMQAADL